MKRLKIFLVSMLMTLVGCASVMFSACGENNENMTISLSTSHLEITLGENDNTGSVFATVENAFRTCRELATAVNRLMLENDMLKQKLEDIDAGE